MENLTAASDRILLPQVTVEPMQPGLVSIFTTGVPRAQSLQMDSTELKKVIQRIAIDVVQAFMPP